MKTVNSDRKSSCLLYDLRHFNEIFRKDVTYDNIKSQQENQDSTPLSRRSTFGKTTGGQFDEMSFLSMQMSFLTTSVR